jgi:hypothetical protein
VCLVYGESEKRKKKEKKREEKQAKSIMLFQESQRIRIMPLDVKVTRKETNVKYQERNKAMVRKR